jgi:hypothetical protein
MKARGYDPVARDPWYFPSMEDYVKVISFPVYEAVTEIHPPPVTRIRWLCTDAYVFDAPDNATCFRLVRLA